MNLGINLEAVISSTISFLERNFMDVLKFSASWVKDKEIAKLFLIVAAAQFLSEFLPVVGALMLELGIDSPLSLAVVLLMRLLGLVILSYFTVLPMLRALNSKGYKTIDWTAGRFVDYLLLAFGNGLYACLSLLNRRFIPLVLAFFVLCLITAASLWTSISAVMAGTSQWNDILFTNGILIVLTGLVGVIYYFLLFYNTIRQGMCTPIYLQGGQGKINSIKESWALLTGKVLPVLLCSLVIGMIWFVPYFIISMIISFALIIASIPLTLLLMVSPDAARVFTYMLSIFQLLVSAPIVTAFLFGITYASIGLYDALARERKTQQPG